MTFKPQPTQSGYVFLAAALVLTGAAVVLTPVLLRCETPLSAFQWLVILLAVVGGALMLFYGALVVFRLHYHISRNGIVIQWGLTQHTIPFETIQTIIEGAALGPMVPFRGVNLIGLRFGRADSVDFGLLRFFTTTDLTHSLVIVTPNQAYVISPAAAPQFIKAWQARQHLGPTQPWTLGVKRCWPFDVPFLADPIGWWMWGLAAASCIGLFGYLAVIFADLPALVPIHYNATDQLVQKSALLTLPAAGAIISAMNLVLGIFIYDQEKMAAYFIWSSSIVLQVGLWGALVTLTG